MSGRADIAWSRQLTRVSAGQITLWTSAAVIAVAAHAGAAWWVMQEPSAAPMEQAGAPAILIDLAPMAMAPAAVEDTVSPDTVDSVSAEAAPAPESAEPVEPVETLQMAEAVPVETPVEAEAEPVEIEQAVELPPETVEPLETEVETVEPIDPVEEMVTAALENVEVPLPTARPAPPRPTPERTVERQRPREQARPQRQQSAPSRDAVRAQAMTQQESTRAAAPQANPGASSVSPARWQSRLMAHLERRKRYPSSARRARQEGVAQVRFTIDGSGNVQSVALARSSGVAELDDEVVAMVRRASPVPAPPPGVGRTIVVPVQFNLR